MILTRMTKQDCVRSLSRELSEQANSVVFFILLFGFYLCSSYFTFDRSLGHFFEYGQVSLQALFDILPFIFSILIPIHTFLFWRVMPQNKNQANSLLASLLAKYGVGLSFILLCLLGSLPMLFSLYYLGRPDLGKIFVGYVGSLLVGSLMLAVSFFSYSLFGAKVKGIVFSVVVLQLFMLNSSHLIVTELASFVPEYFIDVFRSLALFEHYDSFKKGVLSIGALWYFVVIISFFLYCSFSLLKENVGE